MNFNQQKTKMNCNLLHNEFVLDYNHFEQKYDSDEFLSNLDQNQQLYVADSEIYQQKIVEFVF
jgi:hypothetical protein